MKLLAFSDVHRDLGACRSIVERSSGADVVVGAGDFASIHEGLEETIDALAAIATPTILVPGNNETEDALRAATAGWESARVLHGEATEIDGVRFFGLGAGIPTTPWDWSFDLSETEATERLAGLEEEAVLVLHSPPRGHCDRSSSGQSLGSASLLAAIEAKRPPLAVCGHIHEAWGERSVVGPTRIANLGPRGDVFEV